MLLPLDINSRVVTVVVDERLQNDFFTWITEQLDSVNSFFRAREAEALHKLRELAEEVEVLMALRGNRRTRNFRSTRSKHNSLKLALSEFYLSLSLLQNFQQLNHTGFRKVLKKHDKLARSERGKQFFKNQICQSYFWKSKDLADMIEKTENLMIDKLEDGNRRKAMNRLRVPPLESKDVRSHWVTLSTGWLMGFIFVSLIVILVAVAWRPYDSWDHITPSLRGLRVGFILSLWFYAFAINTYVWRKNGVNKVLIFEFDPRNYLNFVELFGVRVCVLHVRLRVLFSSLSLHLICLHPPSLHPSPPAPSILHFATPLHPSPISPISPPPTYLSVLLPSISLPSISHSLPSFSSTPLHLSTPSPPLSVIFPPPPPSFISLPPPRLPLSLVQ